jgi:hypothetical protein
MSQTAFAELDGNFDYLNIPTEHLGKVIFRKDSIEDVKLKYPSFRKSQLDDGQTILLYSPKHSIYSEIRVGFGQNKLEWIEFVLKERANLETFLSRYGEPSDVNRNYHPDYNYYDYSFFNVSTDKNGKYLYSITLFDTPKLPPEMQELNTQLPDWNTLNSIKTFIPGNYLEATFGDDFESLYPKFNEDGSKTYTINKNITSKYQKVELVFKDGLLKKVMLYPNNLSFAKITSVYGKPISNKLKNEYTTHEYSRFSVLTDLKNNVIKITI